MEQGEVALLVLTPFSPSARWQEFSTGRTLTTLFLSILKREKFKIVLSVLIGSPELPFLVLGIQELVLSSDNTKETGCGQSKASEGTGPRPVSDPEVWELWLPWRL